MRRGFTLIEVLIVITIVGILTISLFTSMRGQRQKAEDAKVMSDIEKLKIAFEDYYGDNNCYPPLTWFDSPNDCGSNQLSPYLSTIPCDPRTKTPYYLEKDSTGCGWYKLYGILQNPQAFGKQASYSPPGAPQTYNYGVSSGNVTLSSDYEYIPTNYYYYCSAINNCTSNPDPANLLCTPVYINDANCGGTSDNKCQTVGSCSPR